jgi:hypothetical protein
MVCQSKNTHQYVAASNSFQNSLAYFTGIRWCNLQDLPLWIKECKMTSFLALGMWSERNTLKKENGQLVPPSQQCSSTVVDFDHWFLSKEQCDNTGASPILSWPSSSWFYLFPHVKSALKVQHFYDANDIIKKMSEELSTTLYFFWYTK